jgi:hypothetical protein
MGSRLGERHILQAFDPVDYRLEQVFSSGIGQQALPQAGFASANNDAGMPADGSPVRRA